MVSAVRSRPNHYETLGLTSSASESEIEQAFARKMGELRWHPVGSKAVICIAYETLRDPAKRAAYDRSLGLISKTAPRQWGFAVAPQRWAFIAAEPASAGAAPLAEPHVTAERQLERRHDVADARLERHIEQMVSERLAEEESADRSFDWKKPILAVGGFVIAAGLIGTLAGLSVTDNEAPAQAESAVAVGRPQPGVAAPSTAPEAALIEADHRASDWPAHTTSARRPTTWAKHQIDEAQSPAISTRQSETFASNDLANDPLAPQPAAAALPLSNSAVAHTLDRIGYSCGGVSSTTAIGGGAFKVICNSGKTYQAKRVHGRYRFSRSAAE